MAWQLPNGGPFDSIIAGRVPGSTIVRLSDLDSWILVSV